MYRAEIVILALALCKTRCALYFFSDARLHHVIRNRSHPFQMQRIYVSRCLFSHSRFDRALSCLPLRKQSSAAWQEFFAMRGRTRARLKRTRTRERARSRFLLRARIIAFCYSTWFWSRDDERNSWIILSSPVRPLLLDCVQRFSNKSISPISHNAIKKLSYFVFIFLAAGCNRKENQLSM